MKKKLLSALLCATMVAGSLAGCGGSSKSAEDTTATEETTEEGGEEEAEAEGEEEAAGEDVVTSTAGDPNGTHFELWTFVELHGTFYLNMVEEWNKQNPDKTIEITATTYPYGDMHQKLLMSLQAGTGAPDICDVEVGQFPNVVAGESNWLVPLNDAASPYLETMVTSRMETYQGADGNYYGAPFHVGATVMYYNLKALEDAGLSQKDVDAVVTWDDYEALGKKYLEAIGNPEGKYWTSVDTGGVDWPWIAMAEYGEDWTGGFEGPANVKLDSVKKMLTMQQKWLDEGVAQVSPDGHVDLEAGFQNILDHNIVSFPKAMWYMSRFLNYMPEETGNWYIAPMPVFEKGQPRSVGVGGTGTVVTNQSKDTALAAEFICWAKMGTEGETYIWENLGFDVCNTALWTDDKFAHNDENAYNKFFRNYPYDVLSQISKEIGKISVVAISPTINEQLCTTTLNEVLEDGMDVDEALAEAQDAVDLEQ
ncbi:MAG: extracellular solute-binding protein [Lachnospiraceae bacterium]|nr:extracellular solute-binding protein [Lachnospiraceae bacterium]